MGETDLWFGTLARRFRLPRHDGVDESIQSDARKWFFDSRTYVGSFLWVCFSLDVNPDYIRRKLLEEARLPEGRSVLAGRDRYSIEDFMGVRTERCFRQDEKTMAADYSTGATTTRRHRVKKRACEHASAQALHEGVTTRGQNPEERPVEKRRGKRGKSIFRGGNRTVPQIRSAD